MAPRKPATSAAFCKRPGSEIGRQQGLATANQSAITAGGCSFLCERRIVEKAVFLAALGSGVTLVSGFRFVAAARVFRIEICFQELWKLHRHPPIRRAPSRAVSIQPKTLHRRFLLLPIHQATLEDNDEAGRLEMSCLISKMVKVISLCGGLSHWVIEELSNCVIG